MKKTILAITATSISSTVASAALHLTFTEEDGNVVMRTSGSVDITDARFVRSRTTLSTSTYHIASLDQNEFVNYGDSWSYSDYFGVDLNTFTNFGYTAANSWSGDQFLISGILVRGDNMTIDGGWTPSTVMTWNTTTFAAMKLDMHPTNTDVAIWKASATSNEESTIYLRLESSSNVPEPSSVAIFGLSSVAFLLRRRR